VPARLARTVRATRLWCVCDRDFPAVIEGCAEPGPKRARTWINTPIRQLYGALFQMGHCHTVEVYDGEELVGGLYGVSLGAAFFGESMFHRVRDASKIALVHLVARLRLGGFELLDTQFLTDHLKMFGATEVPQERYGRLLAKAIRNDADLSAFRRTLSGAEAVRLATE
jgi:leucyl/phenylalanyl-tRNA--protein transferase